MTGPEPARRGGVFITFEGGEGVGKTTQIRLVERWLADGGARVVTTREPGGSPGAEAIRDLLVRGAVDRWSPVTEALLMNAARRDHIETVITPALERGDVVLCDRFADSTMAYQGLAGGLGEGPARALETLVVGDVAPDLTLVLDLPVEQGLERAAQRGGDARFEQKGAAFHERVRAAFLKIAKDNPDRCVVIAADRSAADVFSEIQTVMTQRIARFASHPAAAGEGS